MTRQELVESVQQHVDLTGEGWCAFSKDERMPALGPTEIWPVRPDRMFPVKHPTEFLTGYIYRGPDGTEVPLEKEDRKSVVWGKRVYVRVDLGGSRIIKKKQQQSHK